MIDFSKMPSQIKRKKLAAEIVKKICAEQKFCLREITGVCRERRVAGQRAFIARKLFLEGFSSVVIGYTLNKDHTTVLRYKEPIFDYVMEGK